mgnify:CR=1 FL=1
MSDPALGLLMLALIVVVIMMGFATAFALLGLGMFFGFIDRKSTRLNSSHMSESSMPSSA